MFVAAFCILTMFVAALCILSSIFLVFLFVWSSYTIVAYSYSERSIDTINYQIIILILIRYFFFSRLFACPVIQFARFLGYKFLENVNPKCFFFLDFINTFCSLWKVSSLPLTSLTNFQYFALFGLKLHFPCFAPFRNSILVHL